jgi:hypothetical protein
MNWTRSFAVFALFFGLVTACEPRLDPLLYPVDAQVQVGYDDQLARYPLPVGNLEVVITSTADARQTRTARTDAAGLVRFPELEPGVYRLTVQTTVSAAEFNQITGIPTSEAISFSGELASQPFNSTTTDPVPLKLSRGGLTAGWVIKQVYYAGSDRVNGAASRDQFIELYNNSDQTRYADSLCLAQLDGSNLAKPDLSTGFFLPNGQYDWSKSVGMPATVRANDDYVYATSLLLIPGTGRSHPVGPGGSLIVAQTAQNHRASFTGTDGKPITVLNPALTIDLSRANFEVVYASLLSKPLESDVDNPQVPNAQVVHFYGTDWILDQTGRDAYAILKSPEDVRAWPKYANPTVRALQPTTRLSVQVPKRYVVDAVEIQPGQADGATTLNPKKLAPDVDLRYAAVPKGAYSSQALIRKTSRTVGTRRVLQDTNDSAQDFEVFDLPLPGGFR